MKYEFIVYVNDREKRRINARFSSFLKWLEENRPQTQCSYDYTTKDFEEIKKYCNKTILENSKTIYNSYKENNIINDCDVLSLSGIVRLWELATLLLIELKVFNATIILNIERRKQNEKIK